MRIFHLLFRKESDGDWYIVFPGYPFAHHNLMMVAGANLLCEYAAQKEGRYDYAEIDVTTGNNLINGKNPDVKMIRYKKGYGATYHNQTPEGVPPLVIHNGMLYQASHAWICPVTLLILGSYPKAINVYIKD